VPLVIGLQAETGVAVGMVVGSGVRVGVGMGVSAGVSPGVGVGIGFCVDVIVGVGAGVGLGVGVTLPVCVHELTDTSKTRDSAMTRALHRTILILFSLYLDKPKLALFYHNRN